MKFLSVVALLFIFLNIVVCPILSTHLHSHEGCMAGFVTHVEQMESLLFAVVSTFVFSIIFVFVYWGDFLKQNLSRVLFLYERKKFTPDKTKINWLAILFHAPPCFR